MSRNIRISKREMKEDKFTTFMLLAKERFMDNWTFVAGGVALIIIIVAAMMYYQSSGVKKEAEASEIFARAESDMYSRNYQLAIVDFKNIVDDFSSTVYARQALFNLGNSYFYSKNYTEARAVFEDYLEKYNDDKYFTVSAIAGIAATLVGTGDLIAAADKYREAAEKYPDFSVTGEYLVQAMKYYIKGGQPESAKVVYAKLSKQFEGSKYHKDGQRIAGEHNIKL